MHDVSNLKSNRRLYLDHLIWVCSHTSLKALMRPFDAQMAVSVLTNWVTYANSILIDGDKNNGRKPTVSRSEQKALLKRVNHKESRDFLSLVKTVKMFQLLPCCYTSQRRNRNIASGPNCGLARFPGYRVHRFISSEFRPVCLTFCPLKMWPELLTTRVLYELINGQ